MKGCCPLVGGINWGGGMACCWGVAIKAAPIPAPAEPGPCEPAIMVAIMGMDPMDMGSMGVEVIMPRPPEVGGGA